MLRLTLAAAVATLAFAGSAQAACRFNDNTGHPTTQATGSALAEATQKPWFINDEPVTVGGRAYIKYGQPRELGEADFKGLIIGGAYNGVLVFQAQGSDTNVVYLATDAAACTFQTYVRKP